MKNRMFAFLRAASLALVVFAAGCCSVSKVDSSRIGVCSWSWREPIAKVAEEMDRSGVKGVHLALGPFIAPDERHGSAEGEAAWKLVKEKVAKGEWVVMSTMVGTVGEDYSTLEFQDAGDLADLVQVTDYSIKTFPQFGSYGCFTITQNGTTKSIVRIKF